MKYSIASTALLIATVAAQPHGHAHLHQARDVTTKTETAWVTETEYVTEIVDATTTMWVTPGHDAATTSVAAPVEPSKAQQFFEPPSSVQAAPTSVAAPPQQQAQAPPASTAPPAAPAAPATTVAAPAPVQQQAPPPAKESPAPAQSASAPPKSGGEQYSGDLTYYAVGLGSCGFDDSGKGNAENIVAISSQLMGAQSNGNAMCGKTITISSGGKSIQATVRDKCPGCTSTSIDVSEHAFLALFGDLGVGRGQVTWSFN